MNLLNYCVIYTFSTWSNNNNNNDDLWSNKNENSSKFTLDGLKKNSLLFKSNENDTLHIL